MTSVPGKQTVLTPICRDVLGDLNTPVSAFLRLNQRNSFLLESVIGGENVARYSFIGFDPYYVFKSDGKTTDPIQELEAQLGTYKIKDTTAFPGFMGGAVGYFSWESIGHIEKISFATKRGTAFPMAHFLFPKQLMIFDHAQRKITLVVLAKTGEEAEAEGHIEAMKQVLMAPISYEVKDIETDTLDDVLDGVASNYDHAAFKRDVDRVKKHIHEGDVFQLVLSQRFTVKSDKTPFDVYRSLRTINPSPYMYFFEFGDYQIIGSSPEILSRLENDTAQVRPLAGTRPRVQDGEAALIAELKADEKEKAEHIMLVDLGRNDLGRVCDYESIQTTDLMAVEKYSHVMHMVSHIEGHMRSDKTAFDLFRATFPAGTLSGAPKVRAIEIIESMEPDQRGPYGGGTRVL